MKYLFAAACALAFTAAVSGDSAHAKGGGSSRTATTHMTTAPEVVQRDHRIPYVGRKKAGVRIEGSCNSRGGPCRGWGK